MPDFFFPLEESSANVRAGLREQDVTWKSRSCVSTHGLEMGNHGVLV